jgi:ribosome-binding factor A
MPVTEDLGRYSMPREFSRNRRVADVLQRELAALIREELQDRQRGLLTVSGVKVSPDLAHAKVYVTLLENKLSAVEVVQVLNDRAGLLRYRLAQRLEMRTVPRLSFSYDDSTARGNEISALIDAAVAADERKH